MRFVIFQESNDLWYWYWELRASDDLVVAVSPKGMCTWALARDMVEIVRDNLAQSATFDRAGNLFAGV